MEQRINVEEKIIDTFKEMVLADSFEKITVSKIAERAHVSRQVFYNHFKDKYELMDYMLYNDITKHLEKLLEHDMVEETIKFLFTHIYNERKLYKKLFDTVGQNNFEKVMIEQFTSFFGNHLDAFNTKGIPDNPFLTPYIISQYLVIGLTMSMKIVLSSSISFTIDEAVEAYFFLVSHSIYDVTQPEFMHTIRSYTTL